MAFSPMYRGLAVVLLLSSVLSFADAVPLSWHSNGPVRVADVQPPLGHRPGFTRLPVSATGVAFTNVLPAAREMANANLMNGSGVALGDYDGDGWCDIYFCDLDGKNALFRNLGDWHFTNMTATAGVACPNQTSTGAVFADVNGDGRLDLVVSSMGGPHACFINLGGGKFTNTIATCGITSRYGATSMAFADVDGNGTLDMYQANYGATSIIRSGGALNIAYVNGRPVVKGRYARRIKIVDNMMWELGEPDFLYLNDGHGRFTPVSWTGGVFLKSDGTPLQETDVPWDQGLSVQFRDVNGDGAPDIYVCNDAFTPDRFWINDGKGHFRELDPLAWRTTSHFSMAVDFADIDRDGHDDFFVVDMLSREHRYALTQKGKMPARPYSPNLVGDQWQVRRNTLQHNNGDGTFSDIAFYAGVAGSEWTWSGIFLDVDLDGWEDILVCNGFNHNLDDMDTQEKIRSMGPVSVEQSRRNILAFPPLLTPNLAFRNRHDLILDEAGKDWGFDALEVSNGAALADLDNDGDLDVVINCMNAPAILYRNESSAARLGVRLKGKTPNTQGVGARITVTGGPVIQSQEMLCGGRYLSGDDPMRVFACASVQTPMRIEVRWRSGLVSVIEDAEPNRIYEIDESGAQMPQKSFAAPSNALFLDISSTLQHTHPEPLFDDFVIQPSLPHRLSQFGPAILSTDLTGDGLADLVIGTGRGGDLAFYRNNGQGKFVRTNIPFDRGDSDGMAAWQKENGESELLVSISNYEQNSGRDIAAFTFKKDGTVEAANYDVFAGNSAGGPLALTLAEGGPMLFAGSRFVPGKYPLPASSHLYRFKGGANGKWELDTSAEPILHNVGLVSAAVWSDLDADKIPELILAIEWGPIRIFGFEKKQWVERTKELGLAEATGLWQSITAADVNGDGRVDLIAGNWGLNSFYNQAPDHRVSLYYGEFAAPGRIEMIEAYEDPILKKAVPWRDKKTLSTTMPWLNEAFPTHSAFASASMEEILSGKPYRRLDATVLESLVFLNRGGHFERAQLPREAQLAPVFSIGVADFNGDGVADIFLAQNFFAVREEDSRLDAGRGLLLFGSGKEAWRAASTRESGLQVYGAQRGCAILDVDGDGRPDLAVAQNGAETKLYRNTGQSRAGSKTDSERH